MWSVGIIRTLNNFQYLFYFTFYLFSIPVIYACMKAWLYKIRACISLNLVRERKKGRVFESTLLGFLRLKICEEMRTYLWFLIKKDIYPFLKVLSSIKSILGHSLQKNKHSGFRIPYLFCVSGLNHVPLGSTSRLMGNKIW